jgi:hypothetical protein
LEGEEFPCVVVAEADIVRDMDSAFHGIEDIGEERFGV